MVVGSNLAVDADFLSLSSNHSATTVVTDGSYLMHITKHMRLETALSNHLKPCLKSYTTSWAMEILLYVLLQL